MEMLLACLLMGLGIGIDVALATFVRGRSMTQKRTIIFWLVGVSLTHTLFPMLGYSIAYFSINSLPFITPLVGVLGFVFIAYFIKQELSDKHDDAASSLMVNVGLILAVSWDALWSGPAKSAQVVGWPEFWVWFSFIIVGLVVFLFAGISLWLAKTIVLKPLNNNLIPFDIGQWLQLSVVGYFGLLALLRYTFQLDMMEWKILVLSLVLISICLMSKQMLSMENEKSKLSFKVRG